MHLSIMTNEQLRALIAVVEHGSFRAAAAAMFKTQPTISASVRALEEEFGISLFDRGGYRPTLTTEGKAFFRQAKQVIKQASELEMLGHQLAKGDVATLSISLSAMCASPPGLDTIKNFCIKHPNMQLNINTEHLSGVLEQLQLEKSDLAIGPNIGLDESYDFVEITQLSMITVAAPGYLSVGEGREVPQKELRLLPHILISDTGSVAPFDHVNVLVGGRRWYVNDYQMKKTLLLSAMGWARIPLHIVEKELESGLLVPLKVENFTYQSQVPIYLIRLRLQPLSHLAKLFWDDMLASGASV